MARPLPNTKAPALAKKDQRQGEGQGAGNRRRDRLAAHVVDRDQGKRQDAGGDAPQQQERPQGEQVGHMGVQHAVYHRAQRKNYCAGDRPDDDHGDGALAKQVVLRGPIATP